MNFQILILFTASVLNEISSLTTDLNFTTDNSGVITITQGQLKGKVSTSRKGQEFNSFLGIPYGKVTARFKDSEAADGWEGIRQATEFGSKCPQLHVTGTIIGKEDCLFLNVFTPIKLSQLPEEKLAVMVFIHGGAFVAGSSNEYGAEYFMDHGIVLVTINYRLGPLGFLSAMLPNAAGNQGFKDQVLALQWVQKNIQAFNGDSERVVIFGESAGGASVSLLTLSPMAKGLFSGAIAQSGSADCDHVLLDGDSLAEARKLAYAVDCPGSNPQYMIQCLQTREVDVILSVFKSKDLLEFDVNAIKIPQFMLTLDSESAGSSSEVFMPDRPSKLMSEGRFNKVSLMTGSVTDESSYIYTGVILQQPRHVKRLNEEWGRVAPPMLLYAKSARDPCTVSSLIKKLYFGNSKIGQETKFQLGNMFSDRYFLQCIRSTALLYSKNAPVYLYNFTYSGDSSLAQIFQFPLKAGEPIPPAHGDELQYMFYPAFFYPKIEMNSTHFEFSEKFLKIWTSFAKNGRPTSIWEGVTEWPVLNPEDSTPKWLNIDQTLIIKEEDSEFTNRMAFWENITQLSTS